MSENGNGSNRLIAYAVAAVIGAGGAGATGGTWWARSHQHEEVIELRRSMVDLITLVQRREAIADFWIERLRELEKQLRQRGQSSARKPS